MFELLFKYPSNVFAQGSFVLLSAWPKWLLWAGLAVAAAALGWVVLSKARGSARVGGIRALSVWLLQAAMAALLLFLLWKPALNVATLKPQQNIVAVLLDDSASMAVA